jgi:hypothetical protein
MSETYNSQLDPQNEIHDLAKIGLEEFYDKENAMLAHWEALDEERGE